MLQDTFYSLPGLSNATSAVRQSLWNEIENSYSKKGRHYHNLSHLENLLALLQEVKPEVADWDTLMYSMFYHDIEYNVLRHDNEEKSAEIAVERMLQLQLPTAMAEKCRLHIIATKQHLFNPNQDTNLFTDADLAILGSSPDTYAGYAEAVRKEYSIYPDLIYNPGRKKVLHHFLEMEHIYKTPYFRDRFGAAAKTNLTWESGNI